MQLRTRIQMIIGVTSKRYEVRFRWNQPMVDAMKEIRDARWIKDKKCWYVPLYCDYAIQRLAERFGVVMNGTTHIPEQIGPVPELPDLIEPLGLKREPFPFQSKGVARGIQFKRFMNCDSPGLGKTFQSIATAIKLGAKCILVICPNTLKLNWQKEWMDCAGIRAMIITDKYKTSWKTYHEVDMCHVFIINYEYLRSCFVAKGWKIPVNEKTGRKETFKTNVIPFKESMVDVIDCVIVDESHSVKEENSLQTKLVLGICKNKPIRMLLTGTPIVNKPYDLFAQLAILGRLRELVSHLPEPVDKDGNPNDPTGRQRFLERYCDGRPGGASNLKELNYRLNQICFFRREKKEVLKDLPDKIRQIVVCELTNQAEYDLAENEFIKYLLEIKKATAEQVKTTLKGKFLTKMNALRQVAARGKLEAAQEYINEVTEDGQKIIIFFHHHAISDELKAIYPEMVTVEGRDDARVREQNMIKFRNDPACNKIGCSLKSGGVGLNLVEAWEVLLIEQPFTDALVEQAIDRSHRIGQKFKVRAGILLGRNTIDEYVYYEIILKKRTIASQVTGDELEGTDEIVDGLLKFFDKKQKDV